MHSLRRLSLTVTTALLLLAEAGLVGRQFTSATTLVVLDVRVTDRRGAHVADLPQAAFHVFSDGQPQPVSLFLQEDAPTTVGLMLDSSMSMWAIRDALLSGAQAFAKASHPSDEFFAIAFNERRWPALPPTAPFTDDRDLLRTALTGVVHPKGRTALFDAIRAGLAYASRGSHPRKALVVVSDGGDNASTATLNEVIADTQASNVVVYGVALVDPLDSSANPDVLRRLARASGGEAFVPRDVADLTATLEHIASDIRQAYMLGYQVPGSTPGALHTLQVRVTSANHRDLRVRAREGYREPDAPAKHQR